MVMSEVEYQNLTPWSYPSDYMGQTWYGWYSVVTQNRDSGALDKSNYRRVFEDLKALSTELEKAAIDPRQGAYDSPGDATVCDTRVSHWGPGWVEVIYVHSSNEAACKLADEICGGLQDYCVYDESDFCALEHEEQQETWEHTVCGEFSTALGKQLAATYGNSPYSAQRDGEADDAYDKRFDAAVAWLEDECAEISPEGLYELFRQLQDMSNCEWVDGYIDAECVVSRGLERTTSDWGRKALASFKGALQDAMGDKKYDLGIMRYVDPNQLPLPL